MEMVERGVCCSCLRAAGRACSGSDMDRSVLQLIIFALPLMYVKTFC
jgi:hypothetical protein